MEGDIEEANVKPTRNRYAKSSTWSFRKTLLIAVGVNCIINLIAVVVTLVRPTPNFSTSVLYTITTADSASLTRRSFIQHRLLPEVPSTQLGPPFQPTPPPSLAVEHDLVDRSEYWISAGYNLQCKIRKHWMMCELWDDSCGCWVTQTPVVVVETRTTTLWSVDEATATVTTYLTTNAPSDATLPSGWATSTSMTSSTTSATTTSKRKTTKTRTSTKARTTASETTSLSFSTTSTGRSSTSPASTSSSASDNSTALAGLFVGLWIGPMGACLEMSGNLKVCSSPSFFPNNTDIYQQTELDPDILALLPTGTNGATLMLLFAVFAYGATLMTFAAAYKPATRARTREGNRAYTNPRYVWFLAIATLINIIGLGLVFISVIILQNSFKRANEYIPSMNKQLVSGGGGTGSTLTVALITGSFNVLVGLVLTIQDLRLVVRDARENRDKRVARGEERARRRARGRRLIRRKRPSAVAGPSTPSMFRDASAAPSTYGNIPSGAGQMPSVAPARGGSEGQAQVGSMPDWATSEARAGQPEAQSSNRYGRPRGPSWFERVGDAMLGRTRY